MSDFNSVYEEIKKNSEREFNCIPFGLNRFEPYLPGLMQATYYIVTASSGVGKSKLTKFFFITTAAEFARVNNLKMKIFYFSLEESKSKFIRSYISALLHEIHGLDISPRDLLSIRRNHRVTPEILEKIKDCEERVTDLLKHVEVIDNVRNPFGIFKHVRAYARANGTFYRHKEEQDGTITKTAVDFNENANAMYDSYVPNDPDEYVQVITDHISLLTPEKGHSVHQAISKFSSEYCLMMRDKFGYSPVNVQQQEAAKEKQEYTMRGQSIETKLEPSLDGLGDNKLTQRDADVVLGLFAPARYNIPMHPAVNGYDVNRLKDRYRQLSLLKDRDGPCNYTIGLHFKGEVGRFEELPTTEEFRLGIKNYNDYI